MDMPHYTETESPDPAAMDEAGRIAARTHDELGELVRTGASTLELDRVAEEVMRAEGAKPAFYDFRDTEHAITISLNDQLIHTPPDPERILSEGDVVSIDLGANYDGHYSDTAMTHIVGSAKDSDHEELLERTKSTLYAGILQATAGNTLEDIGRAIEEKSGSFGNVTGWAGHFIGRELHIAPQVYNTAEQNDPFLLESGMCIAIEPILTLSPDPRALERSPGGTVRTKSGSVGAHFEHTVRVGKDRAEILTARADEPAYL